MHAYAALKDGQPRVKLAPLQKHRTVALILIGVMLIAIWSSILDQRAAKDVEAGLMRAGLTYASARGLNAVISVAQGTEVNVGVGLGATLSVGEALDPINDLVEQFGDLMLLATVSFGVQKVLLLIGQHIIVKIGLTVALCAWAGLLLLDVSRPLWLRNLLVITLLVRFAVPVAALGTEVIFGEFLEPHYKSAQVGVDQSMAAVKEVARRPLEPQPDADDADGKGVIGSAVDWLAAKKNAVGSAMDPHAALKRLKETAEGTVQDIIKLIVVFLLETLVFPVAILFALIFCARGLMTSLEGRMRSSGAQVPDIRTV